MEEIRFVTNFINNKALGFEQTSPLAVPLYSFGTQFAQSALFCVHPKKGAVAFCYSPFFIFAIFYRTTSPSSALSTVKTVPGAKSFVIMVFAIKVSTLLCRKRRSGRAP